MKDSSDKRRFSADRLFVLAAKSICCADGVVECLLSASSADWLDCMELAAASIAGDSGDFGDFGDMSNDVPEERGNRAVFTSLSCRVVRPHRRVYNHADAHAHAGVIS